MNMQKNAIIYCRVSTTKQAQEGESLDVQEQICSKIAEVKLQARILKIWRDSTSGRKEDRPVIDEILEYVEKSKVKIDYFVFRDIDRLTRAGSKQYQEIKERLTACGVELVDSYGLIQPMVNTLDHLGFEYSWSKHSPSGLAETLKADVSRDEVRSILTRLIGAEISLVQQGYQIGPANEGFLNDKIYVGGKKKTIQIPDPEKAHFIQKMFEMRASGQYSDTQIVNEVNSMGFRTRPMNAWDSGHEKIIGEKGGEPLTEKRLQRYIQRPIYCGIIVRGWTRYQAVKAQFDGLVSIKIFNEANRGKVFIEELSEGQFQILFNQKSIKIKKVLSRQNPLFPFKGCVLCSECKKGYLGSSPKGKSGEYFPTYHCGGKKQGHKYVGIPKVKFEQNVEGFVKSLELDRNFMQTFEFVLKDTWRLRQKEVLHTSIEVGKNITTLKSEKEKLIETIINTTSQVVREALEKKIEGVDQEIVNAEKFKQKSDVTESDIQSFINCANYLVEHLEELLLDKQNIARQQALFGLVFEELPTYQEILDRTPKLSLIFQQKRIFQNKNPLNGDFSVTRAGFEPATISLKGCCSTS